MIRIVKPFVWLATLAVFLLPGLPMGTSAAQAADTDSLTSLTHDNIAQARKKAAHRKRRIVMDNDGNEVVYYMKEATAQALLDSRTTGLAGTQVDTIVFCTWSSGFGMFTHHTKVGEVFTSTEEQFSENKTQQLLDLGLDPLKIVVDFCKQKEIEVFWSMRMNDTHDSSTEWYGPLLVPQLKKDHPEFLVGSKEHPPKVGRWTAVDFRHSEIRDLAFRYIEEVCQNYDVDGVVLDYCRHPMLFKSHAIGGEPSQEELDMLTEMMRRVRKMTDAVGVKRNRPMLVTVRVPDSVEYCRAMGIDLVRWLDEGLVDLMAVSGYFRMNPWQVSADLGHRYDVPVLACLSESRIKGDPGKLRNQLDCYRGRATNVWDAGMDGIYTFNFFNSKSSLWQEIGEPATIKPLARVYTTGARGTWPSRWYMTQGERFMNRSPLSPETPRSLKPGQAVKVSLRVGEDLAKAGKVTLSLDLQTDPPAKPADLTVTMNGTRLSGGVASEKWVQYAIEPTSVRKGVNHIEVTLASKPAHVEAVKLQDLVLWVRPGE